MDLTKELPKTKEILPASDEKMEQTKQIESDGEEFQTNWGMAISLTVIVNILAGVAGWFFYRRWKNKDNPDLINLTGEMG